MARQSFERTKGVLVSFGPRKKRARDSTSLRSTLKDLFGGKPDCTYGRKDVTLRCLQWVEGFFYRRCIGITGAETKDNLRFLLSESVQSELCNGEFIFLPNRTFSYRCF